MVTNLDDLNNELTNLNQKALQNEYNGLYKECLEILEGLIKAVEKGEGNLQYSKIVLKDLYERACYSAICLKDF